MVVERFLKCKAPEKMKVLFWLAMEQKILTWNVLCKRRWNGLNRCSLCCLESESAIHIFFQCSFSSQVWKSSCIESEDPTSSFQWEPRGMDGCLEQRIAIQEVVSLPCFVLYFIWWVKTLAFSKAILFQWRWW
jgi:hypothetical protein